MSGLEDGRVEDGEVTECAVCEVTMHLYAEDNLICPGCAHGGWEWTKAMYVRRGDHVALGGESFEVEHEEDFGLRKWIHLTNGSTLMRRQTSPVLVQK